MENNVKATEYRLYENLVRTQEMISLLGFDEALKTRIVACKELLKTRKYVVAVMGEFKRGKSSLINALLGSKVLPADVTPTTATINRITYGAEPGVQVHFLNGTVERVGIHQLPEYVSKLTPEGAGMARQIREAVVTYPTVICQNAVDIIDTPGLDDDEEMTRVTIGMIAHADAVIIPILSRSPFSETENRFVCDLIERENIGHLMFVVTYMDQLDEDDYVYDAFIQFVKARILNDVFEELDKRDCTPEIRRKAHRLLDGIHVHGISSSLALESFLTNDRKKREKSHFQPFYEDLLRCVTADQVVHTANKVHLELCHIVDQFEEQNARRMQECDQESMHLKRCHTMFDALTDILLKDLNSKFLAFDGLLKETTKRVNAYKPTMMRAFIASLTTVRVNTHQCIFTVLNEAQTRIRLEYADAFSRERDTLMHALLQLLPFFRAQALPEQGLKTPVLPQNTFFLPLESSMKEFAQAELSKLRFVWTKFPIPQTSDLSRCNVIVQITAAVEESVGDLIKQLENTVVEVRKNWFLQARTFAETVNAAAQESLRKADEAHDMRYKVYQSNYYELSAQSRAIIEQSKQLNESVLYARDGNDCV